MWLVPDAGGRDVEDLDLVVLVVVDPEPPVGAAAGVARAVERRWRPSAGDSHGEGAVGVERLDQLLARRGDQEHVVGGVPGDADGRVEAGRAAAEAAASPTGTRRRGRTSGSGCSRRRRRRCCRRRRRRRRADWRTARDRSVSRRSRRAGPGRACRTGSGRGRCRRPPAGRSPASYSRPDGYIAAVEGPARVPAGVGMAAAIAGVAVQGRRTATPAMTASSAVLKRAFIGSGTSATAWSGRPCRRRRRRSPGPRSCRYRRRGPATATSSVDVAPGADKRRLEVHERRPATPSRSTTAFVVSSDRDPHVGHARRHRSRCP